MLERVHVSAEGAVTHWLAQFSRSLADRDEKAVAALFQADSHWRNLCGIAWDLATFSGHARIARELIGRTADVQAAGFAVDAEALASRAAVLAGRDVIEAVFRFATANGPGIGVIRLVPVRTDKSTAKAWTLATSLDFDRLSETRSQQSNSAPQSAQFATSWLDERRAQAAYEDREPDVLIVGGGHAGISVAVELKRLGIDALVVDKEERIGDNWRLRYSGLKLHNKTPINHMRYMPFPGTWPDYIPKDKIANWLETYVESMELNFWTRSTFEAGVYNAETSTWHAWVRLADGKTRVLRPKHIVLATSVTGIPHVPHIPTLDSFGGKVLHSSAFKGGAEWNGRSVVVIGTGTSAHDICQELEAHGAHVTMVQRSPTMVVNVEPSAQLYDKTYLGDGPSVEVRDVLNSGVPVEVMKAAHKLVTREVKRLDAPLLTRLEKAGFKLEFGEDETGWPLKFRTRRGGYYFNVGCSDLIADGRIRLIQASGIKRFVSEGLELANGETLEAHLVVLATGYKGLEEMVKSLLGADVAERVGPIWGFDPDTQELRNMWTRTRQPGLWFTGGSFSQARIYSRFIALQIDAIEAGRLEKAAS
jgi:cation diffusion facilitator CzcD-associated flavoprotein CzcO